MHFFFRPTSLLWRCVHCARDSASPRQVGALLSGQVYEPERVVRLKSHPGILIEARRDSAFRLRRSDSCGSIPAWESAPSSGARENPAKRSPGLGRLGGAPPQADVGILLAQARAEVADISDQ